MQAGRTVLRGGGRLAAFLVVVLLASALLAEQAADQRRHREQHGRSRSHSGRPRGRSWCPQATGRPLRPLALQHRLAGLAPAVQFYVVLPPLPPLACTAPRAALAPGASAPRSPL